MCIQICTHGCTSSTHSLWATSLVWCTRMWSTPPVWMSKPVPRYLVAIAEHSMCQPGKPRPHGESHSCWRCTPGVVSFQSAKSAGWRFLDVLHAAAGGELVEVEAGEVGVAGERRDVEVDAVVDHVGVALLLERRTMAICSSMCAAARGTRSGSRQQPAPVVGPLLRVEGGDLAAVLPVAAAASSILSSPSSAVGRRGGRRR